MRRIVIMIFIAFAVITLHSCEKDKALASEPRGDILPPEIALRIKAHGFGTKNVRKVEEGYIVEGDILLTPEFLNLKPSGGLIRIAEEEQYRTTNLVTSLPRTFKILVSGLGPNFVAATDTAIRRYNALGLQISFLRISYGKADIQINGYYEAPVNGFITYGNSGFPTSTGMPYGFIKLNVHRFALGSEPEILFAGSVIQHELGHCIGFRHTDYFNRSFSCGGAAVNEGAGNSGAILIPGTPSGGDPNSWMLACQNVVNRTFNANDIIALDELY